MYQLDSKRFCLYDCFFVFCLVCSILIELFYNSDLAVSLLEAINDKNSDVQESVSESLVALGRKRAEFILKCSFDFVIKNQAKVCASVMFRLFYLFFSKDLLEEFYDKKKKNF